MPTQPLREQRALPVGVCRRSPIIPALPPLPSVASLAEGRVVAAQHLKVGRLQRQVGMRVAGLDLVDIHRNPLRPFGQKSAADQRLNIFAAVVVKTLYSSF
jgi:hypothetical protein